MAANDVKDFFPGFLIEVCFYFSHKIIFKSSNFSIFEKVIKFNLGDVVLFFA